MENEEYFNKSEEEKICLNCGLRSYNEPCPGCGFGEVAILGESPKEEDEDEVYDWRERK